LNRFIKYINCAIGLALLASLGCLYWFAWRVLPQSTGRAELPVSAAATVVRDSKGVPHITAASDEDAWFLQGYAAAQDRLFQLETFRRLAKGELAAIFGKSVLDADMDSRRFRIRRLAEQHARALSPADRAPMVAYARGVNAFIDRNRDRLPVEFTLLGASPEPWTLVDSVSIALYMFKSLTTTWRDEITKMNMLAMADQDKVEALFPVRVGGEDALLGSNAWAISGKRTASGKPLLASDPHLQFSVPSLWYEVRIKTPRTDVAGVQLPGLPGVLIGHNRRIAWGMTVLHYDSQDLYQVKGAVQSERETIQVRGDRPVEAALLVSPHGPVVITEGGKAYALRWAAAVPGSFEFPIAELNRAANWTEFRAALKRYPGPGASLVYADVDGNIGFQAAGKLPLRKTWNGDVPVLDDSEWDGTIPFEDLPKALNPESGMVVAANQNPFPPDYKHRVHGNFAAPYRARQVRALLSARDKWTAADMPGIQKDIYSAPAQFLARQLAAAASSRGVANPQIEEAARMLAAWNGQMDESRPEPFIAILVFQHLRKALLERVAPGQGAHYDSQMGQVIIEGLLRRRPPGWFPDWDQVLVKALADALDEGGRIQGRTMSSWRWGNYNRFSNDTPVTGRIPVIGRFTRIGPAGLSGAPNAVSTTTNRQGPSMRFVADLADWERSTLTLVTGQSGHPLSFQHGDQFKPWLAGTGLPMPFDKVEGSTLEVVAGK
jgi:penicillin amidase